MTNPVLSELTTNVNAAEGAMESAVVLINGIQARVDAAVQAALNNGATEAELAPFVQLSSDLSAETQKLADAVAANPGNA